MSSFLRKNVFLTIALVAIVFAGMFSYYTTASAIRATTGTKDWGLVNINNVVTKRWDVVNDSVNQGGASYRINYRSPSSAPFQCLSGNNCNAELLNNGDRLSVGITFDAGAAGVGTHNRAMNHEYRAWNGSSYGAWQAGPTVNMVARVTRDPIAYAGNDYSIPSLITNFRTDEATETARDGASIVSRRWELINSSNIGSAPIIESPNQLNTNIRNLSRGDSCFASSWTFRLTVTDNADALGSGTPGSDSDTLYLQKGALSCPPPGGTLNVYAGANHVINPGEQAVHTTASVTGGTGPYTYSWVKVGGPSDYAISNPSALNPTFRNMYTVSTYTYELTVTDSVGATDSDSITISVLAPPPPPIDGECGAAHGQWFLSPPTSQLCSNSSFPPLTTVSGGWTWTCSGSNGGNDAACYAALSDSPPTVDLRINNSNTPASVTAGTPITVGWTTTGTVTSCTASGAWSGNKAYTGSQTVSSLPAGTHQFRLACSGPGGSGTDVVSITVTPAGSYSSYCGDGAVNQPWEECDGAAGTPGNSGLECNEICQLQTSCVNDKIFARIEVNSVWDVGAGNQTDDVYLGPSYKIPNNTWILVEDTAVTQDDPDYIANLQTDVPGILVRRIDSQNILQPHVWGGFTSAGHGNEEIIGNIKFYNATIKSISTNDQTDPNGVNHKANEINDNIYVRPTFATPTSNDEVDLAAPNLLQFSLGVNVGADSFNIEYEPDFPACGGAPTVTFGARKVGAAGSFTDTLTVDYNDDIELNWNATNADSCVAATGSYFGPGFPYTGNLSDTITISNLTSGKLYGIVCSKAGFADASAIVVVTVNPAPPPPQCSDGADNDGDGLIDMLDPGCSDPTDDDETDLGGGLGGSLDICVIALDSSDNVIDLSTQSITIGFDNINGCGPTAGSTVGPCDTPSVEDVTGPVTFGASSPLNADLLTGVNNTFAGNAANDAYCQSFPNMFPTTSSTHYYGTVRISGSGAGSWATQPLYNDQYTLFVDDVTDFYQYDYTPTAVNGNADGVVGFNSNPDRQMVVLLRGPSGAVGQDINVLIDTFVCDSISDLPRLGGGASIDSNTRNGAYPNCSRDGGWSFTWEPFTALLGPSGIGPTTVGPTAAGTGIRFTVPGASMGGHPNLGIRMVEQSGYLPFGAIGNMDPTRSSELWCHSDMTTYDNLSIIQP